MPIVGLLLQDELVFMLIPVGIWDSRSFFCVTGHHAAQSHNSAQMHEFKPYVNLNAADRVTICMAAMQTMCPGSTFCRSRGASAVAWRTID